MDWFQLVGWLFGIAALVFVPLCIRELRRLIKVDRKIARIRADHNLPEGFTEIDDVILEACEKDPSMPARLIQARKELREWKRENFA